jgi:hypothetical protein
MTADTSPRSRRAVLLGAAGGLAALAAQALGRAAETRAADPNDVVLGGNNIATNPTIITNTTAHQDVLDLRATGRGSAIWASSSEDSAIRGHGVAAPGVEGTSGSAEGVLALSTSGVGLRARSDQVQGVVGRGAIGVEGISDLAALWGVFGSNSVAQGMGVGGQADHASGIGVWGASGSGRGGEFHGGRAQVRLAPSAAATHPDSGKAGDVFVDASKRVWFCKGGTRWARLDT